MKPSYTLAWGFLLVSALTGCEININDLVDRDIDVYVTEPFSVVVDASTQSRFRLDGINGNVVVIGDPEAAVARIEGEKRVGSDSRTDAESYLERIEIVVASLANEIRVETLQPRATDGRSVTVDYEIVIPIDMEVVVENTNGNVVVETVDRDVTVEVINGNVEVIDVVASAAVDVTNGNVQAEVLLPTDGFVDIRVTNGNIELDVPVEISAELEADVTNGSVTVAIPGYQAVSGRSVRLTLGDGEGLIDLDTTNGNIRVGGF